jgi:hypothetical protein
MISSFLSMENGDMQRDSVKYYAGQLGTAYGDLLVTDMLIEEGNFSAANTLYNNIGRERSLNGEEAREFERWGRALMDIRIALADEELDITMLDTNQADTLQMIADSARMWARFRAQAWLQLYDGRGFENPMLYPEDEEEESEERFAPQPNTITALPADKIYPNPMHDQLTVEVAAAGLLDLCDVTGRTLLRTELSEGRNTLKVQLPAGLYLYRVWQDGRLKHRGKILKD